MHADAHEPICDLERLYTRIVELYIGREREWIELVLIYLIEAHCEGANN